MVAKQVTLNEQSTDDHQFPDPYDEEEEEEENDTLSLCDLPLTSSGDSIWDECFSNKDDQNSSLGDEGFFEFFSEDFTSSIHPTADKIIFCGKVIDSKEEETAIVDREPQSKEFNPKKGGLLIHKLITPSSRHKETNTTAHRTLSSQGSINKASIMSFPLVKSRWYVFAFGMGTYSMEMGQKDIKMRQSRRAPATKFRTVEKDEVITGNGRRSGKGLWGLLRLFGCQKKR